MYTEPTLVGWLDAFMFNGCSVAGNSVFEDQISKLKEELAAQLERFNTLGKVLNFLCLLRFILCT